MNLSLIMCSVLCGFRTVFLLSNTVGFLSGAVDFVFFLLLGADFLLFLCNALFLFALIEHVGRRI